MIATVYSHDLVIGQVDLKIGDSSMGHLYGTFSPTPAYSAIRDTVRAFYASANRDYPLWASLRLLIQLDSGYFLFPEGGIAIEDTETANGEPLRLDIAGVASEVLCDYFETDPPTTFVEAPWTTLTVEEKIALERELTAELGAGGNNPAITARHVLEPYEYEALCRSAQCDDVLYAVHGNGPFAGTFALVHLTWSSHKDINPAYPRTTFFASFAAFRAQRMLPDHIDFDE